MEPRTTAQRLHILSQIYEEGQASELMDRTLEKLFTYEAEQCQRQLAQLESDLANFETKYNMSSDDFYQQFQAGQTDDRLDYVEWASLIQMRHNLKKRLELLLGDPAS